MESSWSVRKPPSTARSNVRSGCWSSCREIAGGLKEVGRKEATGIALPGKRGTPALPGASTSTRAAGLARLAAERASAVGRKKGAKRGKIQAKQSHYLA